jgi:RNA polymerase sigma factor for flagellar operon FliA
MPEVRMALAAAQRQGLAMARQAPVQPDADIQAAWLAYKAGSAPQARDLLILHYSYLVKYVVGKLSVGLPPYVDRADLFSYGILGLIDAIDRFEPERGFKFETYAIPRIRGAVLDELRHEDWTPRSVRSKARRLAEARSALWHQLSRSPTDEEVAQTLGVPADEIDRIEARLHRSVTITLDEPVFEQRESLADTLVDPTSPTPVEVFECKEMRELLTKAIGPLPERWKLVLTLYYFEGFSLQQIGDVLGVSESRVCQLHNRALRTLRDRLALATSGEAC